MPTIHHSINKLPYAYDAFGDIISEETMRLHHTKHHKSYCDKLNDLIKDEPSLVELDIEKLIAEVGSADGGKMEQIKNNAGGVYNHQIWWPMLSAKKSSPTDSIAELAKSSFGSLEGMEKEFKDTCKSSFGSSWVWLVMKNGVLDIKYTKFQDNPLGLKQGFPVLGCDLWEHAYYIDHRNRKNEWIDSFWKLINWKEVENRILMAESYE